MMNVPVFKGRRRIEINCSMEEFLNNPLGSLKSYIGTALSIHNTNVKEMEEIHKQLVGEQTILYKERTNDTDINNKEVENHLLPIWRFKTSYIVGRPIQYSNKGGENNDDMKYFNRYLSDSKKAMHDIKVYGDVYEYGVGYRMLSPNKKYDEEYETPVEDTYLDAKTTFCCYSSGTKHELLFSCLINKLKSNNTNRTINAYTIYFEDYDGYCNSVTIDSRGDILYPLQVETMKGQPVIEYIENKYRLGIVEIIIGLQHIINHLDSSQLDDIDQFVEAFQVFMNIDVDLDSDEGIKTWKHHLEIFRKTRAIVLTSMNEQMPADFRQITNSLDHTAINSIHNRVKSAMYDIAKAPQASGSVTSGGDTTGARMLGNGWESALNDAELSTTFLEASEYQWVKTYITECKNSTNNKIDNIYPSEIEIKYNINLSDNALVKTQAISNLYNCNMPKDLILTAVPILSDKFTSSKAWEEYDNLKKEVNNKENINKSKENVTMNDINDLQNKANQF